MYTANKSFRNLLSPGKKIFLASFKNPTFSRVQNDSSSSSSTETPLTSPACVNRKAIQYARQRIKQIQDGYGEERGRGEKKRKRKNRRDGRSLTFRRLYLSNSRTGRRRLETPGERDIEAVLACTSFFGGGGWVSGWVEWVKDRQTENEKERNLSLRIDRLLPREECNPR